MVHSKNVDGRVVILAVLFKADGDEDNKFLRKLKLRDMSKKKEIEVCLQYLWGTISSWVFYHYKGSSTIPPCEENVDWIIVK